MNIKKAEVWGFFTTAELGANILNTCGRKEGNKRREERRKGWRDGGRVERMKERLNLRPGTIPFLHHMYSHGS